LTAEVAPPDAPDTDRVPSVRSELYLTQSAPLRYASGAGLYFAQGVPKGLLVIAMPAWLAANGVEAGRIAAYLAVAVLPWAFKLAAGPLMDRFEFLPMGVRRPWVLAAQLGLVVSLCGLTWIGDPLTQLGHLTLLGAVINVFAATQDVAIDGLAIDLVPDTEHGRINAFMSFGKALGWALSAAASGTLLVQVGLGPTGLVAALVCGLLWIAFLMVRERPGERLLPWSPGRATTQHRDPPSFRKVFARLHRVLWSRTSLLMFVIMLLHGLASGYGDALMPIAAVKLFGFTPEQWSQLVASMGLTGAFIALAFGPLIDRWGAKRMLLLTTGLVSFHALLLAATESFWVNSGYVLAMLSLWVLMDPIVMVCVIALAMTICTRGISATQFAVYMSTANMGVSLGSGLYGQVAEHASYPQSYLAMALILIALLGVIAAFRREGGEGQGGGVYSAPAQPGSAQGTRR
jgi:PAT family beta-lactamase induction signal transducer AmpG